MKRHIVTFSVVLLLWYCGAARTTTAVPESNVDHATYDGPGTLAIMGAVLIVAAGVRQRKIAKE